LERALGDVDFIIPALEDDSALRSLTRWSLKKGVPLAFDPQAYAVSSSKLKSAEMFKKIGLPIPLAWPRCNFPVLAKPGIGSGSKGVRIFQNLDAMQDWFGPVFPPPDWVMEEFIDGSQHSLEVIGRPGNYRLLQVTDLYVDQNFDCQRVVAPSNLPLNLVADFERLSLKIAEAINLHGIMDVEAIYNGENFKVLEVDARLPSQTPTAVYWSTNQNMVQLLGSLYASPDNENLPAGDILRGAIYEHIHVCGDILNISGEGIMTQGGPLKLHNDFFGADEALTNYVSGQDQWVATMIYCAANRQRVREKRDRCIAEIVRQFKIKEVIDAQPVVGTKIAGGAIETGS
jgi:pyrrolysine biosynthesis protein PylC